MGEWYSCLLAAISAYLAGHIENNGSVYQETCNLRLDNDYSTEADRVVQELNVITNYLFPKGI